MQVRVIPARGEHYDQVMVLLGELWPGRVLDRRAIYQVYMESLASRVQLYYVAVNENKVVGFMTLHVINNLWAQGSLLHIEELVISESCRGQGIGQMLINHALLVGNERDCRSVEVTSAFHRTRAHSFYERCGFEKKAYHFVLEQTQDQNLNKGAQ